MEQELATQLLTQMAELKATVEAQNSGWFTLGAAGLGGVFGICASWLPTAWSERQRRQHETQTLRASLIAEITAMAAIIRSRGYLEDLQAGAGGRIQTLKVNVPDDYFRVFKANVGRLGLLEPDEASRIVTLYQLTESVIQDVVPGGVLSTGEGGQAAFQHDLAFLRRALTLADQLVAEHTADQQRRRRGPLSVVKGWFIR